MLLKITGVLAVLLVVLFSCPGGTLIFWMMLGSSQELLIPRRHCHGCEA